MCEFLAKQSAGLFAYLYLESVLARGEHPPFSLKIKKMIALYYASL